MEKIGWVGLAAALLLSGCGMFSGKAEVAARATPAPEPVAAQGGGDWLMVSCHLNQRGCREEGRHGSEQECKRAARALELDNRERRAACRHTG